MELHPEKKNIIGVTQGGVQNNNKEMMVELHVDEEGDFSLLRPKIDGYSSSVGGGLYDRPLSCFGCGIGWFLFLLGFACPPLWYYATVLYFGKYYLKDPRERSGLAASAIAALMFTFVVLVSLIVVLC